MARARPQTAFACSACGHESLRWTGRCAQCHEWGTIADRPQPALAAARLGEVGRPMRLADIPADAAPRRPSGVAELDRVLGGGIVPGSLILIGGEPGIGKSTLVLQALAGVAQSGAEALLITGEESAAQVRSRATRLGDACGAVSVLAETRLEAIVATLVAHGPAVCAIDSVQTLACADADGAPGSVSQLRHVTAELMRVAKERDIALILVGHVTKDGQLAGPRLLEHMVDAVLAFEGEPLAAHRILRAVKNRFGSTDETGIFEMAGDGLRSVADPGRIYLSGAGERIGSCLFPAIAGTRALLVEIEALVSPTAVIPPRRTAGGVDRTRLAQVLAVLAQHGGIGVGDHDVFVSVAGGARAVDPAADVAIALAIASAHKRVPVPIGTVAFGELGLTGALRSVGYTGRRLAVAADHGARLALRPPIGDAEPPPERAPSRVSPVGSIREVLEAALPR